MIKISKTSEAPPPLKNNASRANTDIINKLISKGHLNATDFDSSIYGCKDVKKQLKHDQHDKCAYCESNLTAVASGDVEHFRPKTYYQQARGGEKSATGYYWLAYDWKNLLYSCEICNRTHKKNLFPLLNPDKRADTPDKKIESEEPVLINPLTEDPEQSIGFHRHIIYGKNRRGSETIKIIGLDRPELNVSRDKKYKILETFSQIFKLAERAEFENSDEMKRIVKEKIESSQQPEAEYCSMSKCAIEALMQADY